MSLPSGRSSLRDGLVRTAKSVVARLLDVPAAAALWRRIAVGPRAVVLTYHRLLPAGTETWSHPGIIVTPETFERQMRLLRREFRILSLAEFERHLESRTPFPAGSCLVTFDDGWIDTHALAWPILRRLEIPAVVFLPTQYIGSTATFWQEEIGRLVGEAARFAAEEPARRPAVVEALNACGLAGVLPAMTADDREAILDRVRLLKQDPAFQPARAVNELRQLLGPRAEREHGDRFMSWDHAREMAAGGIAFGAHGHTHRILSRLPAAEVDAELSTSRAIIERELGVKVTSMSYPNGGWNAVAAGLVESLRFAVGFSMDRGPVAAAAPRATLRRVNIHEGVTATDAFFRARLLGAF